MLRVLFLCTQNSARSQMAEGLTKHYLGSRVEAESAGIAPAGVNPYAIRVMAELGIDISGQRSKQVDELTDQEFDYLISLCSGMEQCPIYGGKGQRLHRGFPDPAAQSGREAEKMAAFRQVRDALHREIIPWLEELISSSGKP